ncbi:MAG: hypothetical protein QM804_15170 [Propionicimonas sp.]
MSTGPVDLQFQLSGVALGLFFQHFQVVAPGLPGATLVDPG